MKHILPLFLCAFVFFGCKKDNKPNPQLPSLENTEWRGMRFDEIGNTVFVELKLLPNGKGTYHCDRFALSSGFIIQDFRTDIDWTLSGSEFKATYEQQNVIHHGKITGKYYIEGANVFILGDNNVKYHKK